MIWQKYLRKQNIQITYLKIPNYNYERFLKITERTKIEINKVTKMNTPDDFVNTESNIDNFS